MSVNRMNQLERFMAMGWLKKHYPELAKDRLDQEEIGKRLTTALKESGDLRSDMYISKQSVGLMMRDLKLPALRPMGRNAGGSVKDLHETVSQLIDDVANLREMLVILVVGAQEGDPKHLSAELHRAWMYLKSTCKDEWVQDYYDKYKPDRL